MARTIASLVLTSALSVLTVHAVSGASLPVRPADPDPVTSVFLTRHPAIEASLSRIAARSGLWREAVTAARLAGRRAVILTPDQVVVAEDQGGQTRAFDPTVIAEVTPVPQAGGRVEAVLVVVNLPLLREAHDRRWSLPVEVDADLDRILIHEVYGHALPYLIAGDLSGRCADPRPGERAVDACAIQRENAVRAELGLGRRLDYGLSGLAFARGDRR